MQSPITTDSTCGRRSSRTSMPVAVLGAFALVWLGGAAAQEVANGTLSAAIRASGHACANVIEKKRASESAPIWHVRCNSGNFQVTMKGDSASDVVPLDR